MRLTFWLALFLVCHPLGAESPARQLDAASQNLESILTDLEASQVQVAELRERLKALEILSSEHQDALRTQGTLLAEYRSAVASLEAHDRGSLALAENLRGQLQTERQISVWLWIVTGAAVTVAVVEGAVLGARR